MCGFDRQVIGEPRPAPAPRPAEDPLGHGALACLIIELPLEHDLPGLQVRDGGGCELSQPFRLRCVGGLLPIPFARGEHVPVRRVGAAVQPEERLQCDVAPATCSVGFAAHSVGAEVAGGAGHRLQPGRHRIGRHEHRDGGRRGPVPFPAAAVGLRPQVAREHQRAPHEGNAARVVGQGLQVKRLGQRDCHHVAARPQAFQLHIRACVVWRAAVLAPAGLVEAVGCRPLPRLDDRLAVELHLESLTGPIGAPHEQRELPRRLEPQRQLRGLSLGEVRRHFQLNAGLGPGRRGRHVQVHPQPVPRLVVDPGAVQRVAFHARSYVTREVPEHVLILVRHRRAHRHHVAHPAVVGVDGREDVIEQRPLVVVGVVRVGPEGEEPARQLEHVVDVARLGGTPVDPIAQLVRRAEVLVLAVPAAREAVVLHHAIPEEPRGEQIGGRVRVQKAGGRAEDLGDLRVGVRAGEVVLMAFERLEERAVLELVGERKPTRVARVGIQVAQHLIHAAELGVHHVLQLRVVQPGEDALGPGGELDLDSERRAVSGVTICVAQSGVRLVQRVPGRPLSVQIECGGANFTPSQLAEGLLPSFQRAQVAIAVRVLDFFQLPHDVIRPLLEARVARGGPHQAHRREVMTGDVTGEVPAVPVPAAVRLGLRLEAGAVPVIRQHPVGLEREQITGVQLLGVLERSRQQPDGAQGERPGLDDCRCAGAGCSGLRLGHERWAAQQRQGPCPQTELDGAAARQGHLRPPSP